MSKLIIIKVLFAFFMICLSGCKAKTTIKDSCGDGFLDPGEECDGVGDLTCASLGYYSTDLLPVCNPDCTLDTTVCGPRCGDSTIDAEHGEVCDSAQFGGQTCESLGYHGGTLACLADCTDYDRTQCENSGRCGDGIIQGEWGETCDGTELGGASCESLGYHGGQLGCLLTCTDFDESGCTAQGRCGDALVQSENGELCDGTNLDGQTCISQGFYGGTLFCSGDCLSFSTDVCATVGRCGDGVVQETYGEQCDGSTLANQTCQTLGWFAGNLICSTSCRFDETVCHDIRFLSTGGYHTCAVLDDGSLWCWGRGDGGQLGNGANVATNLAPVPVTGFTAGGTPISAISVGGFHTCALRSDGTLWCWGNNGTGQLGNGTTSSSNIPVQATITDVAAIDAGGNFTCAVKSNGSVWCWGTNISGQLGINSVVSTNTPTQVQGLTSGFIQVSCGDQHACAVKSDGTIRCWGEGSTGQLGNNATLDSLVPVQVSSMTTGISVTTGMSHTCAINNSGAALCWGANNYGQIGNGGIDLRQIPTNVSTLNSGVTVISSQNDNTCATKSNGAAFCWGQNNGGYLGDGTTTSSNIPVAVSGLSSGTQSVTNGYHQNCALTTSGFAFCWGTNTYGQLGDGSTSPSNIPRAVNPPSL